jgi:hypothetical protein
LKEWIEMGVSGFLQGVAFVGNGLDNGFESDGCC